MDFWTTLIAPGILLILGIFCPQVWPCLSAKVSHMWEVKENLVKLEREWSVLMVKRDGLSGRVAAGKRKGEEPLDEVSDWILKFSYIETDINRLLPDAPDRVAADQRCCWPGDNLSNCCLGEEVFKMLNRVTSLSRIRRFEVVTGAPPPVVEIIEEINTASFMIGARQIEITHSEKPENWTWSSIQEASQAATEIATMKKVYWMDIRGSYSTRKLVPGTTYEVVFVVKLEATAFGWHEPVNLSLKISVHGKNEILQEQQRSNLEDDIGTNEWVDVKVGEFVAPPNAETKIITFTMYQHDSSFKKTGLVVKGVAIRPKQKAN